MGKRSMTKRQRMAPWRRGVEDFWEFMRHPLTGGLLAALLILGGSAYFAPKKAKELGLGAYEWAVDLIAIELPIWVIIMVFVMCGTTIAIWRKTRRRRLPKPPDWTTDFLELDVEYRKAGVTVTWRWKWTNLAPRMYGSNTHLGYKGWRIHSLQPYCQCEGMMHMVGGPFGLDRLKCVSMSCEYRSEVPCEDYSSAQREVAEEVYKQCRLYDKANFERTDAHR